MSDPDFGPRGYLPPRAAARARKIILRGPLGLQWVVASVLTGLALVGVGIAYLTVQALPPAAPYEPVAAIDEVDPRGATTVPVGEEEEEVVLLRGGGSLRAFAAPDTAVHWCEESGRVEAADGRVWTRDGRRVGGQGASLGVLPVEVFDGDVFVDPTAPDAPEPGGDDQSPGCDAPG
ncbi:hypothetical protein ER308_14225 [Egibacter rhizosphaerae]|uniref:Uncharacterized protein n=1 Tax=Egibacter rhizosphaerae TaxID=1670831 RepID=A0A411YH83_9ACTN|nr:hypothetical protein [Egibacter rhizosphaerae]QBI20600.1 hypothetical protein ER308_14225 [Egibacter rhizosphaerae]